jgi:hypothetical protein
MLAWGQFTPKRRWGEFLKLANIGTNFAPRRQFFRRREQSHIQHWLEGSFLNEFSRLQINGALL